MIDEIDVELADIGQTGEERVSIFSKYASVKPIFSVLPLTNQQEQRHKVFSEDEG